MDDLTFRRQLLANPNDDSPDLNRACQQDPKKAQYREELLQFEKTLSGSLSVTTPDTLVDNILLNQSLINTNKKRLTQRRLRYALAACITMVLVLMQVPNLFTTYHNVKDHSLAHLHNELNHMHQDGNYSEEQLNLKLAHFGIELTEKPSPIKFANFCNFNGIQTLHIVFRDKDNLVTVFVLPKHNRLADSASFHDDIYQGQSFSLKNAKLVVLSTEANTTQRWQQKLTKSIKDKEIKTV